MGEGLEGIGNLRELPQLQELPTHPGVKVIRRARRQARALDKLLDVHEIFAPWAKAKSAPRAGPSSPVGEGDGLRLVIAGKSAGAEHIHVDTMQRVQELTCPGHTFHVAVAEMPALEFGKMLIPHDEIDIDRDPFVTVLIECESANDPRCAGRRDPRRRVFALRRSTVRP